MRFLAGKCEKNGVFLVIDEAFMDFVEEKNASSMAAARPYRKHVLVLRSLTKFFACAGLRLGYLSGHAALMKRISLFQHPWNVNSLAQDAGVIFIKDKKYIKESKKFVFEERKYLADSLCRLAGVKVFPGSANFIFCKIESKKVRTASELYGYLAGKGIIIRDCSNFRGLGDKFFRVAVRTREENTRLIRVLEKILK